MEANLKGGVVSKVYQGLKEPKPPRGWLGLEDHIRMICIRDQLFNNEFRKFQRLWVSGVIRNKANGIVHIPQESEKLSTVWDVMEPTVVIY